MAFGKDFAWGVATASYQIEGAHDEDGKGVSVWDVFSHQPDKIAFNHNGDVACDHYHRFKDDIRIMKELEITSYRFSISWTRIFPDGTGKVNEAGVKFYSDLIDELISNDIEPYITLFHWDYPYELYRKGGWLNDDSIKWFADYAGKIVELFSDRVEYFITFNEPQCFIGNGHYLGGQAPGLKLSYKDYFKVCHNVLKAHGSAVIAMRKVAKRNIKIGYAPTCSAHFPNSDRPEDIEAAKNMFFRCPPLGDSMVWNVTWWSDPVFFGKYPDDGMEIYKEYLPEITPEDMELISQPLDFYGQNIYNGHEVIVNDTGRPEFAERKKGYPRTAIRWPVTPQCLYWGTKFLFERYNIPIYITENGMSAHDMISLDGKIHDPNRIDFLQRYLIELERASDDGVDVRGYFLWTLMDNFEWACGYTERFGIVYVDFDTQERIIKDSGYWYRDLIRTKRNMS